MSIGIYGYGGRLQLMQMAMGNGYNLHYSAIKIYIDKGAGPDEIQIKMSNHITLLQI